MSIRSNLPVQLRPGYNEKQARFETNIEVDVTKTLARIEAFKKYKNNRFFIYNARLMKDALAQLIITVLNVGDYFGLDTGARPRISKAELSPEKVQELVGTLEIIMGLAYQDPYPAPNTIQERIFNIAKEAITNDTDSKHPLLAHITRVRVD